MSYKDVRKELTKGSSPDDGRLPCSRCATPTLRSTLTQYGARCFECYEASTREPRTFPDVGSKDDPRSWARALKQRHENGERLTPAQIKAYRRALKEPVL